MHSTCNRDFAGSNPAPGSPTKRSETERHRRGPTPTGEVLRREGRYRARPTVVRVPPPAAGRGAVGGRNRFVTGVALPDEMADGGEFDGRVESTEIPAGAWSVSRLNERIASVLTERRDDFPTYVVGEVSEVARYDFGTFFTLGDREEEAVVSCLAWSSAVESFDVGVDEGVAAVVRASVDFYAEKGRCQLNVDDYWPVGESARSRAHRELRRTLDAEGLLDPERARTLPEFPDRVAAITSTSGSAREDLRVAIHERAPGVDVAVHGATVQGSSAVPSLVEAIAAADSDPRTDILVVTRGGGADADLRAFDEEPVVRVIAETRTPTVVAIGHEDDETLAELVADRRAMTPTDAGVATVPDVSAVRRDVAGLERRIDRAYRAAVSAGLSAVERRIERGASAVVRAAQSRYRRAIARRDRARDLEHRIRRAYRSLCTARIEATNRRLDAALRSMEAEASRRTVTARAARTRAAALETRIDGAYRSSVARDLESRRARVHDAHRSLEATAKVEAGTAEARRLRVVVAVLLLLLVVAVAAVALGAV